MRKEPTATLVAKCKRAAKAAAKTTETTHAAALEEQASLAGYASWHELLAAHQARIDAPAVLPLDPKLPKGFYMTPNEDRPAREIEQWWDRPYAVTEPDGRLDVRCLDGGAWDRPTFYGSAADMAEAVKIAGAKLAKWIEMRSEPVASMSEDGLFAAVLMPQRPHEDPKPLSEPMTSEELRRWLEERRSGKAAGPESAAGG